MLDLRIEGFSLDSDEVRHNGQRLGLEEKKRRRGRKNHLALAILNASLAETRQALPLRLMITYCPSNAFRFNSSRTVFRRHLPASIAILLG